MKLLAKGKLRFLVPGTLFGRMVLVLLSGLLAAELLAGFVLYEERIQTSYQASGLQSAQRISEIVLLLESHTPNEREQLVKVLSTRFLRIALSRDAPEAATMDAVDARLTNLFLSVLRRNLSDERPIQVAIVAADTVPASGSAPEWSRRNRGGQGMGMGHGHRRLEGPRIDRGLYFLARIQLADGTWIVFDHRIPEQFAGWPWRLLATVAILLAAVLALSILAVRWLIQPLSALATAAERLGRDIRSPAVSKKGPMEVSRAACAFNRMQSRLRRFIEDRTRLLAAVSHDLRTPLTRLRLRAEMLAEGERKEDFLKDLDEMRAMADATLDFLRGVETREALQTLDIRALVESLIEDTEPKGESIRLEGDATVLYPARPLALKRCLSNLIENAVKYASGIVVRVKDAPDRLEILVSDTGPGIPEDKLNAVFEPFFRIDQSRGRETGGTGLGLSIARNIARAHGGDLTLRNRPSGGLEAVLELPR